MSSAGRHYRAARASAAAASSQKPARAPVVRGHTPSRRAPPPPAFRSARAQPSAAYRASASRFVFGPLHFAAALALLTVEHRQRCACCRADHCRPGPQGWRQGMVALNRSGGASRDSGEAAATGPSRQCTCPIAGHSARPLQTYRAAGWSARFAGAGCSAHLPRRWRGWAAGPWGGAASVGRLAAPAIRVTEPRLRAAQWPRHRRRAGCDHLGGCGPLPHRRGGISLKEAGTSLFPAARIGAFYRVRERERGCGVPGCGTSPSCPEPELGTHVGGCRDTKQVAED